MRQQTLNLDVDGTNSHHPASAGKVAARELDELFTFVSAKKG
jgi:hypothetical protein